MQPNGSRISQEMARQKPPHHGAQQHHAHVHGQLCDRLALELQAPRKWWPISWRLKRDNGSDRLSTANLYGLRNLDGDPRGSPRGRRDQAGCMGCFIDQSNDVENGFGHSAAAMAYSRDHLATLVELNEQLHARGKYATGNHLGDSGDQVRAID